MDVHHSLKVKFNKDFKNINNSEFVEGTALIAYPGDNRNSSDITEEAFNNALPSLGLIPIVGHWLSEKQNFGGHDITIEWCGNQLVLKDNTVPYGVVKENHNADWIDIEEDGVMHKYLTADVVLWYGRYPEPIQKVIDDGINQSMEINVKSYSTKTNKNIQIDSFEYSALCLLGKDVDEFGKTGEDNVEPCFESASIIVDKFADNSKFKEQFNQLLFALNNNKESNVSLKGGETKKMTNKKEGKFVEEKLALITKYNFTLEQLNFNIEELSIEELEVKLQEFSVESNQDDKTELNFSATYRQKREALANALEPKIERDEDGNITYEEYMWVEDFDDTYVFVEKSIWTDNNHDCKYGRFTYTFDEDSLTATISGDFEEMVLVWLTLDENQKLQDEKNAFTTISTKFETLKTKASEYETIISAHENKITEFEATINTLTSEKDSLTSENTQLKKFKSNVEFENKRIEIESLIEDFEVVLKDNEEFEQIKKNVAIDEKLIVMDYQNLENKLFALEGKLKHENKKKDKVKKPVAFSRVNINTEIDNTEVKSEYGEASKYFPKKN